MLELNICIGSSCHVKGSYSIIHTFNHIIEEKDLHDKIDMKASFCMKGCHNPGVSIMIDGKKYSVEAEEAREFFNTVILPAVEQVK